MMSTVASLLSVVKPRFIEPVGESHTCIDISGPHASFKGIHTLRSLVLGETPTRGPCAVYPSQILQTMGFIGTFSWFLFD
jgi:hypothetical protein